MTTTVNANARHELLRCLAYARDFHEAEVANPNGPMVAITDFGYARIRAHDAIGEAEQEQP